MISFKIGTSKSLTDTNVELWNKPQLYTLQGFVGDKVVVSLDITNEPIGEVMDSIYLFTRMYQSGSGEAFVSNIEVLLDRPGD